MEKIRFESEAGGGKGEEFFVLEQTRINQTSYILVADSKEDNAKCLILKEISKEGEKESVYEIVDDSGELASLSDIFEELLDGIAIER